MTEDKKGKLHIVATPIGNLGDMSVRALDILKKSDLILCEDTSVTKKLLNNFGVKTKIESYHQHSSVSKTNFILDLLAKGENLALTTDAGTPNISDPGGELVKEVVKSGFEVIAIPGPSALVTALSVCGLPATKFVFLGFPPNKTKRQKFFREVAESPYTVVFYESSHRIEKALKNLEEVLKNDAEVCVCRELTKKFETVYRGKIDEILKMKIPPKGEFVVIVKSK